MSQLGLFGSGWRTIVADDCGKIDYCASWVDSKRARQWFERLRDDIAWKSERRKMYDREVDVPRLHASFGLRDARIPLALRDVAALAAASTGVPFNSAGLNYYRDGADSVAPHNDHLHEIGPGFPIALLSLGSVRRMTIRSKKVPRRVLDLDLEHGSLLVMSYETQLHYDHGIPKSREPVGPRISVAFRVRCA